MMVAQGVFNDEGSLYVYRRCISNTYHHILHELMKTTTLRWPAASSYLAGPLCAWSQWVVAHATRAGGAGGGHSRQCCAARVAGRPEIGTNLF